MEYLSSDISLPCLQSPNPLTTSHHHHQSNHHQLLQDFLDHPVPRRPLKPTTVSSSGLQDAAAVSLSLSHHCPDTGAAKVNNNNNRGSQSSFARSAPQQLMGPAARRAASSFLSPFEEGLAAPAVGAPTTTLIDNDPRRKRIMKNRESAARSRARRQAYTYELERERALLIEENARLKQKLREQDQSASAAVPAAVPAPPQRTPTKKRLSRTISASF